MNERIHAIIVAKGIKKTEFAQKLNVSQAYISQLCSGAKKPSNRTISDICREFDVNEQWLRTGKGEMFTQKSRSDEIAAFMGDILRDDSDFRQKFISVLARMTTDEWRLLEKKVLELAEEISGTPARPDADIDREVEDYRRRLILEKNREGGSSPSNEDGAETA